MQLRPKITLLLVTLISVSVISNFAIQRTVVEPSFRQLEHDDAVDDWQRCQNALVRDNEALSSLCFDWGSWDDAYEFVKDKNPAFIEANLANTEWFTDQQIDVLYFCRPDGSVYWRRVTESESGEPTQLAWLPTDRLPPDHPLMAVTPTKESKIDGIVLTELGFMMMSSRPILTSQNKGPLAGVLIFGRLINEDTVAALREQTGIHFDIRDPFSASLSESDRVSTARAVQSDKPVEEVLDDTQLAVSGVIKDLNDKPVMVIQTTGDRNISQRGRAALVFATWSMVALGCLTLLTLLIALGKLVIEPLAIFTRHTTTVGDSGNMTRIDLKRGDELGTLAAAYNQMLKQLEDFRASSITLSRQAGMAEVAAGVLHNVGNAMTNVGVLADTLDSKLGNTKTARLTKVANLLNEHQHDLPAFFSEGAQGKQLPGYITQLASHLNGEVADLQHDVANLRESLQHVKSIVASHQSLATSSNFMEQVDLCDVVSNSQLLVDASFRKHGVDLKLVDSSPSWVSCDRSKLSQVLVNLLTNAKEALVTAQSSSPRVQIRIGHKDAGTTFIEICDNGPGVNPSDVAKLFSKGFTTKPQGHGIGLHYCWLSVREMGGTLTFVETPQGGGCTFRIELEVLATNDKISNERIAA